MRSARERPLLLLLVAVLLVTATPSTRAVGRPQLELSGAWQFRTDPESRGEGEEWFAGDVEFPREIQVPGAWDAQGVGSATSRLASNYVGKAWYRRSVSIPADWRGKRIWLEVGGAHRYVNAWAGGHHVGRNVGYLTPLLVDITGHVVPGTDTTIALRVDSKQDPAVDSLTGCFDVIDAMHITWGGIYRPVRLYATAQTHIKDVFVVPHALDRRAELRVRVGGAAPEGLHVSCTVRPLAGAGPTYEGDGQVKGDGAEGVAIISVSMPGASLWSPSDPALYRATVSIKQADTPLDEVSVRFGLRDIEIRGNDIYLNGERLFLCGYGDDCCFPDTVAPPAATDVYRRRLQIAKGFGFNYVRHHSHVPLVEYFDAADEVGMLVQPELPIAYQHYFDEAAQAAQRLLVEQWRRVIELHRNHPSIFAWCMGNELWDSFALAPAMYRTARELDPTRPVNDSDGIPLARVRGQPGWNRATLDVFNVQFDEHVLPWGPGADKYDLGDAQPTAPVLIHEMGNFNTFSDPGDRRLYGRGVVPFWLNAARDLAQRKGIGGLVPGWVFASRRAQAVCHKVNLEAARLSAEVDGHTLWLLQDYWTGGNGILDQYYREKEIAPGELRKYNGQTVVLWEHDAATYEYGDHLPGRLWLSQFGPERGRAQVAWELVRADGRVAERIDGSADVEGTGLIPLLEGKLGGVVPPRPTGQAERLTVRAEVTIGRRTFANDWRVWGFTDRHYRPPPGRVVSLGLRRLNDIWPTIEERPLDHQPAPKQVAVAPWLSDRLLAHVESGGTAVVLGPAWPLPRMPAHFKTAWWLGNAESDSDVGVEVTGHAALDAFPHEGYGDLQFYHLVNGRQSVLLDNVAPRLDPIVRMIDLPSHMRNKAMLFEATVGAGRLLVSTLDASAEALRGRPEARALLDGVLRYAAEGRFEPAQAIDPFALRALVDEWPVPLGGPFIAGYQEWVDGSAEAQPYPSAAQEQDRGYVVRQLDEDQFVTWRTAPVPAAAEQVTFVLLAGLGWLTEPAGGRFELLLAGETLLEFDVTEGSRRWESADGAARLSFEVRRVYGPDRLGIMYLTLPTARLTPGQPVQLTVRGTPSGSRRWFMLYDDADQRAVQLVVED